MAHLHVVSDLVANVLNVSVAVGDTVDVGDEIVLEESMKMEIPMLAERAGMRNRVAVLLWRVLGIDGRASRFRSQPASDAS